MSSRERYSTNIDSPFLIIGWKISEICIYLWWYTQKHPLWRIKLSPQYRGPSSSTSQINIAVFSWNNLNTHAIADDSEQQRFKKGGRLLFFFHLAFAFALCSELLCLQFPQNAVVSYVRNVLSQKKRARYFWNPDTKYCLIQLVNKDPEGPLYSSRRRYCCCFLAMLQNKGELWSLIQVIHNMIESEDTCYLLLQKSGLLPVESKKKILFLMKEVTHHILRHWSSCAYEKPEIRPNSSSFHTFPLRCLARRNVIFKAKRKQSLISGYIWHEGEA